MPWTFAHPAAIFVVKRIACKFRLPLLPIFVGTIIPDFGYYLGNDDLSSFCHSAAGLLLGCVPLGLLMIFLIEWLREPVVTLLPQPHRDALLAAIMLVSTAPRSKLISTIAAILVGGLSHIIWDSFTHSGRFFVEQFEVLQASLFVIGGREFFVYNLLQHLSSALGVTVLVFAYCHYVRSYGPWTPIGVDDKRRYYRLGGLVLITVFLALPLAILTTWSAGKTGIASVLTVKFVIYSTNIFFILLISLAILSRDKI